MVTSCGGLGGNEESEFLLFIMHSYFILMFQLTNCNYLLFCLFVSLYFL